VIVTVARWVSLIAAFIMGAVAEWKLGLAVGLDEFTAALLPLTLDVWGFAAFATGRKWHVTGALAAMFGAQAVSHLLELGQAPAHMVALSVAVSAIAPGVSLACHRLGNAVADVPEPASETATESAPAVDAELETADDDAETVPEPDDVQDDESESVVLDIRPGDKAALARAGVTLMVREGLNKTQAAERLGYSRQWLHRCMEETGIRPPVSA